MILAGVEKRSCSLQSFDHWVSIYNLETYSTSEIELIFNVYHFCSYPEKKTEHNDWG